MFVRQVNQYSYETLYQGRGYVALTSARLRNMQGETFYVELNYTDDSDCLHGIRVSKSALQELLDEFRDDSCGDWLYYQPRMVATEEA